MRRLRQNIELSCLKLEDVVVMQKIENRLKYLIMITGKENLHDKQTFCLKAFQCYIPLCRFVSGCFNLYLW